MKFTHMLASLKMMSDALFLGRDAIDGNSLTLHAFHSLFFVVVVVGLFVRVFDDVFRRSPF